MQFEFADAEVACMQLQGGVLALRFAAARVLDDQGGGTQWMPLQLYATGVTAADPAALVECMGRVESGQVLHAGQRMAALPVPWQASGPVVLELVLAQGPWLQLHCQTLTLQQLPGAQSVGAFQC